MVVWKAELAQSYIAQARRSRRPSPSRSRRRVIVVLRSRPVRGRSSIRPPRDPFAKQRIDDHVAVLLAGEDVVSNERAERRLDRGRAGQAVARPHVGGEELAAVLEHRGAQSAALGERQALPGPLEQRIVLAEQPAKRSVQVV